MSSCSCKYKIYKKNYAYLVYTLFLLIFFHSWSINITKYYWKALNFSELTQKLELAKDMTSDAVQICQVIFNDKDCWEVESVEKWIDNVSKISFFFYGLKSKLMLTSRMATPIKAKLSSCASSLSIVRTSVCQKRFQGQSVFFSVRTWLSWLLFKICSWTFW